MGICEYLGVEFKTEKTIEESKAEILRKTIGVAVNGEKDFTEGYFDDGKNLFIADFIRRLGFDVGYDEDTKQIIVNPKKVRLNVDGKEMSVEAVNINGFNFCQMRKIVDVLGGNVTASEKGEVYVKVRNTIV
jgi:hypothetical protein